MNLKDDIEVLKSIVESISPEVVRQSLLERLSRIEAALALDDGPPREGDSVAYLLDGHEGLIFILTKYGSTSDEELKKIHYSRSVLLMRAAEVKRRLHEQAKRY